MKNRIMVWIFMIFCISSLFAEEFQSRDFEKDFLAVYQIDWERERQKSDFLEKQKEEHFLINQFPLNKNLIKWFNDEEDPAGGEGGGSGDGGFVGSGIAINDNYLLYFLSLSLIFCYLKNSMRKRKTFTKKNDFMKKKVLLLIACSLFMTIPIAYSQVGIGTEFPDESAILDVTSTNRGVLLPQVELTSATMDLDNVLGQQTGLLVYNTGGILSAGYYFWNGSEWRRFVHSTAVDDQTVSFIGPLIYTEDNGCMGYHWVATTPDGKWSVRCFLPKGRMFVHVNLQLRYNGSESDPDTKDIFSNTTYFYGAAVTAQNNQVRYPKNVWAGYSGASSTNLAEAVAQTSTNFPSWYDAGVYAGGTPEYRMYHWSELDPMSKTFYTVEFMMASTTPSGTSGTANPTNCPDNTCHTTKVILHIRQVNAP